jgi:hypothetical protein
MATKRWVSFDASPDGNRFLVIVPEVVANEQPLTAMLGVGPQVARSRGQEFRTILSSARRAHLTRQSLGVSVDQNSASWNHVTNWLRKVEVLRGGRDDISPRPSTSIISPSP